MRGLGELWQAARDRHALKAVTLLRGRQIQKTRMAVEKSSQNGA